MTTLQDLRDQRATAWNKMTEVIDEAGDATKLSAEQAATYDKIEAEFEGLDAKILRAEKHDTLAVKNKQVDRTGVVPPEDGGSDEEDTSKVYAQAFEMFVKNGMLDMDTELRNVLRSGGVSFDAKEIRNAGGIGTGSAGGYLVPAGFRDVLIEKMKAFGSVMNEATVIDTETGNPLPWATNDDTGNVGALLAENTAASEQDFAFGTAQLGAYKYTSKLFRESIEFLQDVQWFDLEQYFGRKAGERLARIHNQHFTTGTGSSQPLGLVTGATSGVTAASATTFTADELIDLQHAVDPAYRNERSKYMLTDTALKIARKLKDSQGRYLFQASTSGDVPNTINGSGYVVNQDMAVPATGVRSVLYGDYETAYVVRRVKAMEFLRLVERFAEFGQVGFIAFDRMDGTVQDANAYRALTQA